MATIHVDVVSAEESIFSGEAKFVALPGENGELGILPQHTPLITRIKPGAVRIQRADNDQEEFVFVAGGILEVQPHGITVLADTAIRGKDLDEAKAAEAKAAAEEALEERQQRAGLGQGTKRAGHLGGSIGCGAQAARHEGVSLSQHQVSRRAVRPGGFLFDGQNPLRQRGSALASIHKPPSRRAPGGIMKAITRAAACVALAALSGCATEQHRVIEAPKVQSAQQPYRGAKALVAIGKFDNRSSFMRGIFTDGADHLGAQAKTILVSHLQQSLRFNVLERENLAESRQEAGFKGQSLQTKGADFVITGAVAEFGRKEVGDQQLFGLLGRGKSQIAYAKVTLNVVNAQTSEVVYSASGSGEYSLSQREVIGFGGTAGYDATLNGKVLDLAIREAVDRLVTGVDGGALRPAQ